MRTFALLAALCLLTVAAPPALADPGGPFSPTCPFITTWATICVGGVLQCFVSIRILDGDRYCL
jgi:hypothetical protein